jgi:Ca-activated chloride channel family protein
VRRRTNSGDRRHFRGWHRLFAELEVHPLLAMGVRFALCFAAFVGSLCRAQDGSPDKPPETTFRTTTDLVQLNVSVFDQEGKIINGIPQSAFTVFDNGVKQPIKFFREEDVPVSMGLIIDNSASMHNKRERVISATLAMIKASNPDDEVFVIEFNEEARLAQDFTGNIGVLEKSLRSIDTQGETAMRDALLLGIEHMRHRAKRDKRVLVVITDGEDNSSVETQAHLIEAAHNNNVIIYAIGLLGEEQPMNAERARNDVAAIASITPEIAHEIRNQYTIGYKPPENGPSGSFHTVRVDVSVPGATVRTRSGYYARR